MIDPEKMNRDDLIAEVLHLRYMLAAIDQQPEGFDRRLGPRLARMYNILNKRRGRWVAHDQIFAAMYYDLHEDEWPEDKQNVIKVQIYNLRSFNLKIVVKRGFGYKLEGGDHPQ